MEFMLGCVTVNPKKRQSISDLLSHNFIKMYREEKLDCTPMEFTVVTDHGANLYKFQVASVINSIVHRRKSLNMQKAKKIESIYEEFNMTATGEDLVMFNKKLSTENNIKLSFGKTQELIGKKLDPFETKRLIDKLQISKDAMLSYEDAIDSFRSQFEHDLDDIIEQGFNKLDISNDGQISVKVIRQALRLTNKMHSQVSLKNINRQLTEELEEIPKDVLELEKNAFL